MTDGESRQDFMSNLSVLAFQAALRTFLAIAARRDDSMLCGTR